METPESVSARAEEFYQEFIKRYPDMADPSRKYSCLCGIMSAQAAGDINAASNIQIDDEDTFEVNSRAIYVRGGGLHSQTKGSFQFTPWQFNKLLKAMVEQYIGDEVEWASVDLSELGEL
jgi:hypothetical protein